MLPEWTGCDHGGGRAELSPVEVSTWQASSVFRRSTRAFRVRRENFRGGDEAGRSGATFLWVVEPVDRLLSSVSDRDVGRSPLGWSSQGW